VLWPEPTGGNLTEIPGIRRCHINLWSLSSLIPGRRLFYFDVGLELVAGVEPIYELELLLPFRVEEGSWKGRAGNDKTAQDLYDMISTGPAAELVFGGPVRIEQDDDGTSLRIGDYSNLLHLARVNSAGIHRVETGDQREDSSHYTVPLLTPIPSGQARYVRMRWRVFGSGPLWSWKRSRGGAMFDFRVYDVRESRFADSEKPLRARMIPIDEINIFLIAPAKYQVATTSPQSKYLRMLETGAWRQYLRGTAYLWLRGAMVVYYWRHKPESSTAEQAANPLRIPQSATGSSAGAVAGPPADLGFDPEPDPTWSSRAAAGDEAGTTDGAARADPAACQAVSGVGAGAPANGGSVMPLKEPRRSINPDNPFRVFADFNVPGARSWSQEVARLAAAVAVLAAIVRVTSGGYEITNLPWRTVLILLGAATLLGSINLVERVQKAVARRFLSPRQRLRKLERAIIGKQ
jgi:hypothetical protein